MRLRRQRPDVRRGDAHLHAGHRRHGRARRRRAASRCIGRTKGDGVYDKHTVFADKLLLPRMILPLDKGRVLIGETDTNDLYLYTRHGRRRRGRQEGAVFRRRPARRQSGASAERPRSGRSTTGSTPPTTPTGCAGRRGGAAQGTDRAERRAVGRRRRTITARSGSSMPAANRGRSISSRRSSTARSTRRTQFAPDFDEVWPLVGLADVQGGTNRVPARGQDAQSLHRDLRRRDLSRRPAARGTARRLVLRRAGRPAGPPREGGSERTASRV